MIRGIGIDLIELSRMEAALLKNNRLIDRILTSREKTVYSKFSKRSRQLEFLAGRFAAKEAFAKAAGTGIGGLSFQHIEILPKETGAPEIQVRGYDPDKMYLSISHSKAYAIAQVVITE
jgi:holo-[acyl-carrier protein] synthase